MQKLGVKRGDHVAVWLPNGREALITFYAINYLGGVFVPFNTAYRGAILAHVLANSDAPGAGGAWRAAGPAGGDRHGGSGDHRGAG